MGVLLYFAALFVCLAGSFFVALISFKRVLQEKVTAWRLLGFTSTFLFSFIILSWAMSMIVASQFQFGR